MRKIILGTLLFILITYVSPIGGLIQFSYAKILYDNQKYEQSVEWFERALQNSPKNSNARFYYVAALSKLKPTYSIQKKIYDMSISKQDDEAKKMARTQVRLLRQSLLTNLENNYIYNVPMTQGVVRWNIKSFPLKVYINSKVVLPPYYINKVKDAFGVWQDNTNFIKFDFVNNKVNADIVVFFKENDTELCKHGQDCVFDIANTEPEITPAGILKKMTITFYTKGPEGKPLLDSEIYQTAIHEIGHALGIFGHSDDVRDVMYSLNENVSSLGHLAGDYLSERDLKTMVLLYRLKPDISNVKNLASETFYYAPLIIGSKEEVLRKKQEEWKKYIDNYPNLVSGYLNLSSVLIEAEKYEKALSYLDIAERKARNEDESYKVELQRAYVYLAQKNQAKAIEYAQKAKQLKNSEEIQQLEAEIENTFSKK